jgi:hypothetical protein
LSVFFFEESFSFLKSLLLSGVVLHQFETGIFIEEIRCKRQIQLFITLNVSEKMKEYVNMRIENESERVRE